MIKKALWLEKPQYSSDCPASQLSPPWEGQGEAPQVQVPLLGRGRGRLFKSALPSLGGVGGRLRKSALPSLGEGAGVGFCYFLLQMLSQEGAC